MSRIQKILLSLSIIVVVGFIFVRLKSYKPSETTSAVDTGTIVSGAFDESMMKSDEEWKAILSPKEYRILRESGTEIPFTGKLNNEKRKGTYYSIGCDKPIFRSEHKYDSGTGWPSFWAPMDEDALVLRKETGPNDNRIEVLDTCGGHLGHIFDDGPEPSGKRYCINSVALRFVPDE